MLAGKTKIYIYRFYPPFLRILERIRFHNVRQPFAVGKLVRGKTENDLKRYLIQNGFEDAVLAWKDPGELLGMRKIDNIFFQYHVRLFGDGEICGHYEYSSEGSPWKHITEACFEPRLDYFQKLLDGFITK